MTNREQAKADVLQGTLDVMVLQTLDSAGVAARLWDRRAAGASLIGEPSASIWVRCILPCCAWRSAGSCGGKWDVTENNRKARFYAITAAGRRQLPPRKRVGSQVSIMHAVMLRRAELEGRNQGDAARMDVSSMGDAQ